MDDSEGHSYGQLVIGSFIMTTLSAHASHLVQNVSVKHQATHMTQSPYSPDLAPCDFWLFPKLTSPLKRKRFQTIDNIWENTMGQVLAMGELCEVPRCLFERGQRHHCPMYKVSCIFFNKCLYFSYYMAGYLLNTPHIVIFSKYNLN